MNVDRVRVIYEQISEYEIKLDTDPVTRGPQYMQGLIATCRNHLNAVSRIILELNQERQITSRDLRAREVGFQVNFDNLLATDERIRRLPNIEDRKATAKIFLREELALIEGLRSELQDLEYVEKAVKHRHRELTSTMSEIKLQKSLITAEIQTGAMYGDERTEGKPSRALGRGHPGVSIDEMELEQAMEEELAKQFPLLPPSPPSTQPPATQPTPQLPEAPEASAEEPVVVGALVTEAEVESFLGAVVESPAIAEEDYSDIFQNI